PRVASATWPDSIRGRRGLKRVSQWSRLSWRRGWTRRPKAASRGRSWGRTVTSRQQPANPARALRAAAQITATRVTHRRVVAAVPLLNHPHAIVNVAHLAADLPAAIVSVLDPFPQPSQAVVGEVRLGGVGRGPIGQAVL